MAKPKSESAASLYGYSRHKAPDMKPADEHHCQAPEDHHADNYDNDASGWVRGARGQPTGHNETAENKPGFDHSPPRSKMRR